MKKALIMALTLCLVFAAAVAPVASAEAPEYLNLSSVYPIIKEGFDVTVTIASVVSIMVDPADHWIWAHLKQNGNLGVNVTYYDIAAWPEQKNLIFASGNLPDIFYSCPFTRDDLVRFGQTEKMLYDLTDLIPAYAPEIQSVLDKDPAQVSTAKTPDGKLYTLPTVLDADEIDVGGPRIFIHQTWLDDLGLENPQTLDEMVDVLRAFKANDPAGNGQTIPATGRYEDSFEFSAPILTALGINAALTRQFFVDGDKIQLPFMHENYGEYLRYMNLLIAEGLMDPDFFTQTQEQVMAKLSTNNVGVSQMWAPFVHLPEHFRDYQSLNVMTSDVNSKKTWPKQDLYKVDGHFAMAYNTQYPEVGIRFLNTHYTHEGPLVYWIGQYEGWEYNIEGWPLSYMAEFEDNPGFGEFVMPNTELGIGVWDYLQASVRPYGGGEPPGPATDLALYYSIFGIQRIMSEVEDQWRSTYRATVTPYNVLRLPDFFYEADAVERFAELQTPIRDYLKMMESRFIQGTEPLENLPAFQDQMKALGVEEYIQIVQDAYDVYVANK